MNLSSLSLRYPRVLAVAILTVIVWGAVALVTLPRQEEPLLTWRLANVVTRLPGAAPKRVESLITDVLERAVEQVDEVQHIYSVSRAGVSLLQIELSDEVTVAEPVWQKVRHKLAETANELPAGTIGPDLDDEIMGTFATLVGLSSATPAYRRLKDHAQRLEDELRFQPMTASTTLFGLQREVIQVELDPAKLAAFALSFDDVARVIRNRNTRRPSGRLRVDESELLVEASGEFANENELADVVLLVTPAGRSLHLGDVARIRRTTSDPPDPLARVDGQPAVIVGVRARQQARIDRFGAKVQGIVDRFASSLPAGIRCTVLHDLARYTRERAAQLTRTFLLSITFVFLSTAAFMGWRAAGVVTAAIPLTGFIVLFLFSVLGVPLNQMSVMAIIMAMGLVVDNAIVVTEQVHRRAAAGIDVRQAAGEEPAGLFMPLLVSTLTTMAAFLPIYLLPGGTGEFVRAIPIGVGISLLTSLVVAMTAVPWLCGWLLARPRRAGSRLRRATELATEIAGRLGAWYERLLRRTVARPLPLLLAVVLVMACCAALGPLLRRDFFSPVQRDQFVVDVFGPQGSAVAHTAELVEQVESVLAAEPLVESVGALIGRNAPLVFYNLTSQETYANHFAQLIVRVSHWQATALVAQRLQTALHEQIAGAECVVHILEHGAPFIAPFEVRISGPSLETLRELGRRAAEILRRTPHVRNVRSNFGNEALKLVAEVNEPMARTIGIDQRTVADQLRARLDGLVASHMQEGDERIDISLRLPLAMRRGIADLKSVYFKPSAAAGLIPLAAVARMRPTWEAASIYRRDGQRTLSVLAYPEFGRTPAQVARGFTAALAALARDFPPGYRLVVGGENQQRHEAEAALLGKAIYAVCVIVLLLVAEFRSLRLTALILAVIPLSLGGTMLGLWLTGWPLNFMAIMGMMMLIGVVVNDAVILVDGFEQRRGAQQSTRERVVAGTLERTRHVVITTVTTIAGFLPLALSPSLLWPPLAIAIIGGLATSTLLTLVAVPAAYTLIRR